MSDTVRIAVSGRWYEGNHFVEMPVLKRAGVLVIHRPHNEPNGSEVVISHGPSGLKIAPPCGMSWAVELLDVLGPFPFADVVVAFNKRGQPRVTNRKRCPWLKDAKAAIDAFFEGKRQ